MSRRVRVALAGLLVLASLAFGAASASATHFRDCGTRDGSVLSGRWGCLPHE